MTLIGMLIVVVALLAAIRGLGTDTVVDEEGQDRSRCRDALRRIHDGR